MADYLDFGSSSDEDDDNNGISTVMDSDEEERYENAKILKMLSIHTAESTKCNKKILDFEAEMEAELDRRAYLVECEGGMEHQKSLSRSSSSSSLHNPSETSSTSRRFLEQAPGPSCLKRPSIPDKKPIKDDKKVVKFKSESQPSTTPSNENIASASVEGVTTSEDFYDKVYFDSDESEGEDDVLKESRKKKRKFMSNDELFYDPNSDAEDQAWVDKQRRKYYNKIPKKAEDQQSQGSTDPALNKQLPKSSVSVEVPLPTSDAVLNCPACFTTLCMDCQRHEFYSGQYRAMFVMNCKVDRSETLKVPLKPSKNKNTRKNKVTSNTESTVPMNISSNPEDIFFPVRCTICNSQVAVYDNEEIYHFFNCLVSHP